MICDSCTLKTDFLHYYSDYRVKSNEKSETSKTNETDDVNVEVTSTTIDEKPQGEMVQKSEALDAEINQCIQDLIDINKSNVQSTATETQSNIPSNKRPNDTNSNIPLPPSKKLKTNDDEEPTTSNNQCQKPKVVLQKLTGASFWPLKWRSKLCKCTKCIDEYKEMGVEYLLDEDDTVHAYQEKGKLKAANNPTTSDDETMRALSGMDHVVKVEAIMAYNKLKQKLTEFFSNFVTNEQVITTKDVDSFFQKMKKKE